MLRWTGAFELGELMLQPRAMLGVRQTLSDGKIKSSMTFMGNQFNSSITDDRTVGLGQLGLDIPLKEDLTLGLDYYGEYGEKTTNHMGYLSLKIEF